MKLTVFTLATDDEDGTSSQVFTSKAALDKALLSWVGSNAEEWAESEYADDLHEFISSKLDHLDTFSTDEQEIEFDKSDPQIVKAAWDACKSRPGAFGNLYDPIEVMTVMDGWAVEGDTSDASFWFDPQNPDDTAAIAAWCEANGLNLEQRISDLVCKSLPNRKAAYEALSGQRSAPRIPIFT